MIWTLVSLVGLWFGVHWAFAAVMHAKVLRERGELNLYLRVMLWPLAIIGVLLDFAFNATFGWLMFAESPFAHGPMFTARVQHHYRESMGWRADLADWWARHLNALDPGHIRP